REYQQIGGADAGKPTPSNQTVSPEQAAADVAGARHSEARAVQAAEDEALRQALDQLRAEVNVQPQQQQQPQAEAPPVQPDQAAQADDEVARALQNPHVLAAVQDYVGQAQNHAVQLGQAYVNATAQNAVMATASLVAQFPELQNLTPEQIPVAIQ